ncbi:hypothetical protein [Maridesulfovibrio sp.]|uniref:hypothetical protein n=1 Tax=unclassified Maridesulfovibrio TaxID=2794999 RepID=UPI000E9CCC34|nr:hypothetical protein [Desulfovibrio sp.]
MFYILGAIIWILCIWQGIRIAKRRGANPFLVLLFFLLTTVGGPVGLLMIYLFLPDRVSAR